ncbi:MAG TPA: EAL domain-containing protein [Candidatus Omnitrophota bacterium]|nr:EAL domain-containing protein [Candidatus Omnitrophota bacterium]
MEKKAIKILVIEDDPNYFVLLSERLSNNQNPSFQLTRSKLLRSGLERLREGDMDLILLDLMLPDSQGLATFAIVHQNFPAVPIIILTSVDDDELAAKSIALGAQDYLLKGSFDRQLLIKSICYAISRHHGQIQLQQYYLENEASKRTLQDKDERLRSLVANIPGAVYRYQLGPNGWQVEFLSDMIREITGYSASKLMGRSISKHFEMVLPLDCSMVQEAFNNATQLGNAFSIDYRIRHANGDFRWVHDQGRAVKDETGKVKHIDGVLYDITERRKEKEKYNQLIEHDALTNLPNRQRFEVALDAAITNVRIKKENGAVLIIDLDHFKRINDTLGHDKGDLLIQAVSVRLKKTIYDSDMLTRIGGGSFMILLQRISKVELVENVANKILTAFKSPFLIKDQELFTTCSIGIALFPTDGEKSDEVIKHADAAMHLAKERGKDRYQFYSPSMSNKSLERLVIENSLRRALERNEFCLFYQPQFDLRVGKVTGVEALLRWKHPDLGFVPPMQFIEIAEETGLIHPIGEWVLRNACEQKKEWNKMGFSSLRVAVNLSARQFHYVNLLELVRNVLASVHLKPEDLELELTESTIMSFLEETTTTLDKLKEMGIRISIDDFGTGYSSLMYLKTFPINTIKIDKSFVRDVTLDSDDRAITNAIISMAHSLKLDVVAEGVETMEQLELLKSQNCDIIQGFLFSKPIPADEVIALISNGAAKKIFNINPE